MTLAELKKAKELAAKKLAKAKSSEERTKLFSAYEKAVTALSEYSAKTKYTKKTEEKLEKDEDEDDADDDEDDSEDDEDEDAEAEESEESSDDEESEEDSEEEEEEKSSSGKAKTRAKKAAASASLKDVRRMFSLVQKLTGKSEVSEMFGALEGMTPRLRGLNKTEARVAKLESENTKSRVKSMLDVAVKDGRVTPAQAKGLEAQGLKDSKWLKGYLSAQPKQTRSQDNAFTPDEFAKSPTLSSQGLNDDQQKMLQQAAQSAGMSVEDFTKEFDKHAKNKTNGVAKTF